jgi:hypothetical protein
MNLPVMSMALPVTNSFYSCQIQTWNEGKSTGTRDTLIQPAISSRERIGNQSSPEIILMFLPLNDVCPTGPNVSDWQNSASKKVNIVSVPEHCMPVVQKSV